MDKDAESMGIGGVPFPLCQGCVGFLDGEFKGAWRNVLIGLSLHW